MRISMLGQSGSGKTTYMCALHEAMIEDEFCGFSLAPYSGELENSNSLVGIGKMEEISFLRDGENIQFPEGTTDTTYWTFDLLYRNKKLCELDWIDYRGGKIDEIFHGDLEADALKEIIYYSNAIMIFIDSIQLALNDEIGLCKRITGADKLTQLLKNYERLHKNEGTIILIILSKCDSPLIVEEYKKNNYFNLISKCCILFKDVLAIKSRNSNWRIGIVPVSSVGYGTVTSSKEQTKSVLKPYNVRCNLIKYPSPLNVAQSFLFCVKEILTFSKQLKRNEISSIQNIVTKEFSRATSFYGILTSLLRKGKPYARIRELLDEKEDIEIITQRMDRIVNLIDQTAQLEVIKVL